MSGRDHHSFWLLTTSPDFFELAKLSTTTADSVIIHMKSIFARHSIPETVVSDNGPQFLASSFSSFAQEYGFSHVTSSPRFPQANGEAKRTVATVKNLLKKSVDPYLALLVYRKSPLENGCSPSELLMCRKLRSTLPIHPSLLFKVLNVKVLKAKGGTSQTTAESEF